MFLVATSSWEQYTWPTWCGHESPVTVACRQAHQEELDEWKEDSSQAQIEKRRPR